MIAYQSGDSTAFEALYRRYSGKVYGYLSSRLRDDVQANDVFQGVFLKLHQSRAQYDPKFLFAPWLFTVCRTVLLDHLRRRDPLREAEVVDEEAHSALAAPAPQEARDGAPGLGEVDLAGLPVKQREALELRYTQDLSFEEIAGRLRTSPANVRQLISRAIRKLRGGES